MKRALNAELDQRNEKKKEFMRHRVGNSRNKFLRTRNYALRYIVCGVFVIPELPYARLQGSNSNESGWTLAADSIHNKPR